MNLKNHSVIKSWKVLGVKGVVRWCLKMTRFAHTVVRYIPLKKRALREC